MSSESGAHQPGTPVEVSRRDGDPHALTFDEARIGIAHVGLDGRILRANQRFAEMAGADPDDLQGRHLTDVVHPDDHHLLEGHVRPRLTAIPLPPAQVRFAADTGETHARLDAALISDESGDPLYLAVQASDVTDLVLAERELLRSEARFRTILELAEEGVLTVDERMVITFANRRMAAMLGYELDEITDRPVADVFDQVDAPRPFDDGLRDHHEAVRIETRLRRKDGRELWVHVATSAFRVAADEPVGLVAMVTDISELKAAEAELRHRSTHDPLTGLANRSVLEPGLGGDRGPAAALYLDLDGFKAVNDERGHTVGDQLLVAVADRLRASVRDGDLVARLGGDEFLVVSRDADEATALALAERLVAALSEPYAIEGHTVQVTTSAGVAIGRSDDPDELIRRADLALYDAKRAGGCRITVDR